METWKFFLFLFIWRCKNSRLKIISIETFLDESGEGSVLEESFSHFPSQIHSNILVVIKMIFIILLFFASSTVSMFQPARVFSYPSDSTRLRLASRLNYPLFLFSSIFLLSCGENKSQKENLETELRGEEGGGECGGRLRCWANGYCSVLLCNKIEKCKDDADVDEIFFVAAFFSFAVWCGLRLLLSKRNEQELSAILTPHLTFLHQILCS